MITRTILLLLSLVSVASAGVLLVRPLLVVEGVTKEERDSIAQSLRTIATRHGLKDRTFVASDDRVFAMYDGRGSVVARIDAQRVGVSLSFEVSDRALCQTIERELVEALEARFASRVHRTP